MPDIVISRHGSYLLAQGTSGWEVRVDHEARRRSRMLVSTVLLAAAGVLYLELRHPLAPPLALLGLVVGAGALWTRRKVLVLGDTELRYGSAGDSYDRRGAWPNSQVAKIVVDAIGTHPRTADRARRPGPMYVVRIVGRDGRAHPARFTLPSKQVAFDLASAIASRIGVDVEAGADARRTSGSRAG